MGGMATLTCLFAASGTAAFYILARSPLGLAMQAVASAPVAARSIGIGSLPVRTAAFVLAAAFAGLAGGLQAALTEFVAPSSFPFSQSILFLLATVVGGAGRTWGPIVGAAVVGLLPEALAGLAEYRLLVFGAALLLVLWSAPGGIAGFFDGRRKRSQSRHGGYRWGLRSSFCGDRVVDCRRETCGFRSAVLLRLEVSASMQGEAALPASSGRTGPARRRFSTFSAGFSAANPALCALAVLLMLPVCRRTKFPEPGWPAPSKPRSRSAG